MDAGRVAASGPIDTLKRSSGADGGDGASSSLEQVFFEYVNRRQA